MRSTRTLTSPRSKGGGHQSGDVSDERRVLGRPTPGVCVRWPLGDSTTGSFLPVEMMRLDVALHGAGHEVAEAAAFVGALAQIAAGDLEQGHRHNMQSRRLALG